MFETFRKEFINFVESCSLFSAPVYRWDTRLRFTDVNLRLISDIKKYQFVEWMMKDSTYIVCTGYAEVNNKFLQSYDANKPTAYIIYLDVNNLYGNSMVQLFPA